VVPDTSFIAAFANNPLTLSILMVAAIVIITIWKISPFFKTLIDRMDTNNKDIGGSIEVINKKVDGLVTSDAEQAEHIRLNTLDVLRITVYNESVDVEDRLVAAKRYFMRGGNGKVASYVKQLSKDHPREWKTILAMVSAEERAQLEKILAEAV
jgi:hypothetical protein